MLQENAHEEGEEPEGAAALIVVPDRSVKLKEFDGDKPPFVEWAAHVALSARAAPWTDEQTLQRVMLVLKGPAAVWLNNRVSEGTEGIDAWYPDLDANGRRPPNLRTLMEARFSVANTPAEQATLRATLTQKDNENVATFFDRVQSVQFELDKDLPLEFRVDSKAAYDIVHAQMLLNNFLCGLKPAIKQHVTTQNANTCQTARDAAMAYELGARAKSGKISAAGSYAGPVDGASHEDQASQIGNAVLAAMGGGRGRGKKPGRGNRGGQQQQQQQQPKPPGSSSGDFCLYCGYIGHEKKQCNIQKKDERKGIFLPQSPYFEPGRVGRSARGTGRGQVHGLQQEAGHQQRQPSIDEQQRQLLWQQQQQLQQQQQQQQQQQSARSTPRYYNDDGQGGAAASFADTGALRYFPAHPGNQ